MASSNHVYPPIPFRHLWAVLLLPVLLCSAGFSTPAVGDVIAEFKSWFKDYKKGHIALYQPSPVPLQHQGDPSLQYVKMDTVRRMDALLQGLAKRNDPEAARLLVEAATFHFDRRPHVEIKKRYRQQPWILRAHALESLQKITDPEAIGWLKLRCLKNNSGWDATFRKVIALSVLGLGRGAARGEDVRLLKDMLKDRDFRVREQALVELARTGGPEDLDAVIEMMNDREVSVRVAALGTMAGILSGPGRNDVMLAETCLAAAARSLEDEAWTVQEAALALMEHFRTVRSIPALIDFMEKITVDPERYRERIRFKAAEVLRSLTGYLNADRDAALWRTWWARNRESFTLAPAPSPALAGYQLEVPYFFNIPVNTDAVYFILDISGSMRAPLPSSTGSESQENVGKIERARKELLDTLASLDPEVRFNILLFNDSIQAFQDEPVEAREKTLEEAKTFIENAKAEGGTNIFDALNFALQIKSMGLMTRFGENLNLDTVFLLSDGVPTTGLVIDSKEIQRIIMNGNRHARIRINTIYFGAGHSRFMRDLAEHNFGKYIRID